MLLLSFSVGFAGSDKPVLSDRGYGLVAFGDKLAEAEGKIGEKAERATGAQACDWATFKKYPGVKFMVEDGIITRADAVKPGTINALGLKIGTKLKEVQRRFKKVIIEPHKYDPSGHYLIFRSTDAKRALVFEEGKGKITDTRAGLEPSVEYVEGCL